jgi:hypothetical protein
MADFKMTKNTRPVKLNKEEFKQELESDQTLISEQDLFYPGISEFIKKTDVVGSISINNMDKLIKRLIAHTGLDQDEVKKFLTAFFQEMRNTLCDRNSILLNGFGTLSVLRKFNTKCFTVEFIPYFPLIKEINDFKDLHENVIYSIARPFKDRRKKRRKRKRRVKNNG